LVEYILIGLFFLSCLVLIAAVLLQPGKADAGALFTSNISSTAFGPRGTQSVLSKITIAAAAIFMLSALLLSFQAITGNISVTQTNPEAKTESNSNTANSNTANSNAGTNSANSNVETNSANAKTESNSANSNTASNANANK
jgi:preprotein translocase subunit SecG